MDFSCAEARAFGASSVQARIRLSDEDFCVEEKLRFEPEGVGAHEWLYVEKRGRNTFDVARYLARYAKVRDVDVGFAGQKDRHAVTRQWFSVNLGNRAGPDWQAANDDSLKVLVSRRHGKKLKRGQLSGNHFRVLLRDLAGDRESLESRFEQISRCGVPNYFGPQRFGREGNNLRACVEMFLTGERVRDRQRRSMYLSAARAWLFNRVLSRRIEYNNWDRAQTGDILMFDDSRSRFMADGDKDTNDLRLARLELHPTGPLWGKASPETKLDIAALERAVASEYAALSEGLESAGLDADRRALRLAVHNFSYEFQGNDDLRVEFFLRAGAFATTVLAEIAVLDDATRDRAHID